MRDPDDLEAELLDGLALCGCGIPIEVANVLLAILEGGDAPDDWPDAAKYLAYYHLDSLDLTAHGTGIRHAWPTDKGKAVLANGKLYREMVGAS